MKTTVRTLLVCGALASLALVGERAAVADPVNGTWQNASGFGDGPYSTTSSNSFVLGEDPDDPTVNSNWAQQEMIFSPFNQVTLANTGDKVVFTGSVLLTGTINSPSNAGSPRTQFRFGMFQSNASANQTGWVGYFMHNKHGDPGSPQGVLGAKPVGNTSAFLSTTGQLTLQAQAGDGTPASLFNDGTYNLTMSIERNSAGELVLNSSIIGVGNRPTTTVGPLSGDFNGDGAVNAADYVAWRKGGTLSNDTDPPGAGPEDYLAWQANFGQGPQPNLFSQIMTGTTGTATAAATTGTYTFDRLGFLLGMNLQADRAEFSNLDVTFTPGATGLGAGDTMVPEPASATLVAIAALFGLYRRRRAVTHGFSV